MTRSIDYCIAKSGSTKVYFGTEGDESLLLNYQAEERPAYTCMVSLKTEQDLGQKLYGLLESAVGWKWTVLHFSHSNLICFSFYAPNQGSLWLMVANGLTQDPSEIITLKLSTSGYS